MNPSHALNNVTRVAGLGIARKDVRVIKNLLTISSRLRGGFEYKDKVAAEVIDILFVNSGNEKAMSLYAEHRSRMHSVPIFVYNSKAESKTVVPDLSEYPNAKTLTTPITLTSLSDVLLEVVSAQKVRSQPKQSLVNKASVFKMLVVDDSFPVRKYMQERLPLLMVGIDKDLNFEIEFASSGQQAVDKIRQARGAYDLVFLDIIMEDIDGYRVCKWIKKVKRSINVVMLTSKSSRFDKVRGSLSGCDSYIAKPPKDSDLTRVIMLHKKFE